jgi:hypothetical protein
MLAWEYFGDFDKYVWIDGSVLVTSPDTLQTMLDLSEHSDLCLPPHPERNSVQSELDYVLSLMKAGSEYLNKRYQNEAMKEQVDLYMKDTSFVDERLFACTYFVYTRELVQKKPDFFRDWFYHCARYSVQDQLSLPYLAHKHSIDVKFMDPEKMKDKVHWMGHKRTRIA